MSDRYASQALPAAVTMDAPGTHVARPNETLYLDTRVAGTYEVTLWSGMRDGDRLFVREAYGVNSLANNPVTFTAVGAGVTIDNVDGSNPTNTWVVDQNGAHFEMKFNATSNIVETAHSAGTASAPAGASNLDLTGLAGKGVVVNATEDGFIAMTGVNGGTF